MENKETELELQEYNCLATDVEAIDFIENGGSIETVQNEVGGESIPEEDRIKSLEEKYGKMPSVEELPIAPTEHTLEEAVSEPEGEMEVAENE